MIPVEVDDRLPEQERGTMKRRLALAFQLMLDVAAPLALAGGDHYKCTKSTQECLNMMTDELKAKGWLGIEIDHAEDGKTMTIKRVVPGSPAEKAGFAEGDVLVAVNGIKYADGDKEAMMANKKNMVPGKQVTYTVTRAGAPRKLMATLAEVPEEVLASWVGNHMLQHAEPQAVAKKD
jgi:C-terminal processing protease CtpA/Prc